MRFYGIAILLLASASLSFAQLLPQKQTGDLPKIDRALIFKVDYNDKAEASDSNSGKINPSIKEQEKGNYLKNSLIWTGLCVTGAALSAAFGGHGPIWCDPNSPARF
ncbi:hypothetical protein [Fibrobacter sp. UWR2]|uniref:hypothetical protein n=1 Tax=Fibrobacter sp. UWR2 TaxID=1964352 RepID=UPI000B521031|nr:hypothetical protein [Fibrobacter sp. UWR2]OWU99310.1 hypothetical protein B7994_11425 [Fibrobacter sp. UWR2]